jgi:phosphatidylglycerophosphate synthase
VYNQALQKRAIVIDKLLRGPKEQVLAPVALRALRGVSPTSITVLACVVGVGAALAAAGGAYTFGLVLWLLNRVLDGLDGTVARIHGKQSALGGYLDILLDHVVYALVPLGFAFGRSDPATYLAASALLASFYVNGASWMYLSALLEKRALGAATRGELTSVTMPGGLIEGAETIVFFILFFVFPSALVPLFALMALLVLVTIGQRLRWAYGTLSD